MPIAIIISPVNTCRAFTIFVGSGPGDFHALGIYSYISPARQVLLLLLWSTGMLHDLPVVTKVVKSGACMPTLEIHFQSEDSQWLHYNASGWRQIGKEKWELGTPKKRHIVRDSQLTAKSRIGPKHLMFLLRPSHPMRFPSQCTRSKHYLWTECHRQWIPWKI